MGKKMLELNKFQLDNVLQSSSEQIDIKTVSNHDIAIVGMAGKLPKAADLSEFWENLRLGIDCIDECPKERKEDMFEYLRAMGISEKEIKFSDGAYLEDIDKFDPLFFNITPKEASLMDPNQRLFLETAWHAIEDAGYGGKKISGSNTGVYVGFSNDFDFDYKYIVQKLQPDLANLSVTGNIRSIIASRIAYLLDLKGPSMLVDTACSSALTAVHLACLDLKEGRCEMAIVGGVKIRLSSMDDGEDGIGILSSDHRARTFDNSSDGTGVGEGVIALLLKPLAKALEDNDQIHAVIKGSAVNQDGSSIGITAPNSRAQADVIENAWRAANIDPATISYIEAHGTGTILGDPIEIDGITRAFSKSTTKKQFCGVGSVKTNLGHLDHTAGIAGLVKTVLALKNKELPPTLHFEDPNQKINFMDSPVYVVDHLKKWQVDRYPLRCGVSAFGLSGTNCHIILEEAPLRVAENRSDEVRPNILTLSAKNKNVLQDLIKKYTDFLITNYEIDVDHLCYTANTGRGHYSYRLAVAFDSKAELIKKFESLNQLSLQELNIDGIYFGENRIVTHQKEVKLSGELTEGEKREISNQANLKVKDYLHTAKERVALLKDICQLYISGAEIAWEELYEGQNKQKVSLPVYPFERKRCWVKNQMVRVEEHPLLHRCLSESFSHDVYETKFSVNNHWVLREHLVNNNFVVPGTTYLEMARVLARKYYQDMPIEFTDVIFISPLIAGENEVKVTQAVVKKEKDHLEFVIASRIEFEDKWIQHAEGKIYPKNETKTLEYNLNDLKEKCNQEIAVNYDTDRTLAIVTGPRWENINSIYLGKNELLADLELPKEFEGDLYEYGLHPALLDIAVNLASQQIGEGLYLPFSYKKFELYESMPAKFYSYMSRKEKGTDNMETISFDISLFDLTGKVFGQITDYTIKKVHQGELKRKELADRDNIYYEIGWKLQEILTENRELPKGKVLLFRDERGIGIELAQRLRETGLEMIEVEFGLEYREIASDHYIIRGNEEDYENLLANLKEYDLAQILHLTSMRKNMKITEFEELADTQKYGVDSLFYLTRSLLKNKYKNIDIVLISDYVNEVTNLEKRINPEPASLFGLGKVLSQEYSNLFCRCIDLDEETTVEQIILELKIENSPYLVAYREGKRYVEEFKQVELKNLQRSEVELKDQGVYLITGGTGGLGLEVGKYLASKNRVNLALINRSKLPSDELWDKVLASGDNEKLITKIKAIREIENTGSKVYCYNADLAKLEEMQPVIDQLQNRFGRINGVIHCAGVAGDGFLIKKEKAVFDEVLAPKVQGTWILDTLTETDNPDFFIMFSSIAALFGGPGQGDYTAANSYLDQYAVYRKKLGKRTVAINWPVWKETGMAVDYGVNKDGIVFKAISTALAITALDEVLNREIPNVIIGELNYQQIATLTSHFPIQLAEKLKLKLEKNRTGVKTMEKSKPHKQISDVVIKGSDLEGYSPIEMQIAQIWGRVLELEEVDVYASFYDLGGDSILATHLAKEMEQEFTGLLDVADIFTYSSIYELAKYIEEQQSEDDHEEDIISDFSNNKEEINEILERLARGEIDITEVDKLIK